MRQEKTKNVYDLACIRLSRIFSEFDNVYVSFSGGKDSGAMLELCLQYMRDNGISRKLGIFYIDYEVQYKYTTEYVHRIFSNYADLLDIYHICVPFKVTTCTSMYQTFWRPWDEECRELWVRDLPERCYTKKDFPFFTEDMWDYDFQIRFAEWFHQHKKATKTCCLIGIRTQESLNRWMTIHSKNHNGRYRNLKWTRRSVENVYNAYPIYDWLTTDVWTAMGKFGWDYNKLYDLYYKAGVSIEKQRVASPFITSARESLALYRIIDPDMWGKMVCRVNGVNFTNIYGRTPAVGRYSKLPKGHTWESYMYFLLSTLPEDIRRNYQQKLAVSIDFWRNKGGCLADSTIQKLIDAGIKVEVGDHTNYNTTKKPVRMEYLDDIDIAEFKEIPTFKRICICILKNDHVCKYMGFSLNKDERDRKNRIMEQYSDIFI